MVQGKNAQVEARHMPGLSHMVRGPGRSVIPRIGGSLGIPVPPCHIPTMRHMRASLPPADVRPQQHSTVKVLLSFAPYLWPKGNLGARVRVTAAVLFMVGAKAAA